MIGSSRPSKFHHLAKLRQFNGQNDHLMSKLSLSFNKSSRKSALTGALADFHLPSSVKFTLDNEDVHEVSMPIQNEAPLAQEKPRGQEISQTLAQSPSDVKLPDMDKLQAVARSAAMPDERPYGSTRVAISSETPSVSVNLLSSHQTTNMSSRQSRQETGRVLTDLWQTLLETLFQAIKDNYDVPLNVQSRHLHIYLPTDDQTPLSITVPVAGSYKELVPFKLNVAGSASSVKSVNQLQKLDFSSAVGKFTFGSPQQVTPVLGHKVLFVCFTDPDNESPTSTGRSQLSQPLELRCPHFRNKCGIKRLVQTSKIGYSTFSSAEEVHEHNLLVHQEYKFKCAAIKCKQRFKTKQQMQNHQGSIHISNSAQPSPDTPVELLDFNQNQLMKDDNEESKDEEGSAAEFLSPEAASETAIVLRQKLKFKCPICLNRQFISKCKLDWHLKCHERQFKCSFEGCDKSFKQKQHLKNHLLTHAEGVRPFRCTYLNCGKAFKSISHLKDHTQSIHMKLKPFECVFCKSLFSRNSSLKYHIKSIHSSLVTANGELSELAQSQLQILMDSSLPVEVFMQQAQLQQNQNRPGLQEILSQASAQQNLIQAQPNVTPPRLSLPGLSLPTPLPPQAASSMGPDNLQKTQSAAQSLEQLTHTLLQLSKLPNLHSQASTRSTLQELLKVISGQTVNNFAIMQPQLASARQEEDGNDSVMESHAFQAGPNEAQQLLQSYQASQQAQMGGRAHSLSDSMHAAAILPQQTMGVSMHQALKLPQNAPHHYTPLNQTQSVSQYAPMTMPPQQPVNHQQVTINTGLFNIGGAMGGNIPVGLAREGYIHNSSVQSGVLTAENRFSNDFRQTANLNLENQISQQQQQQALQFLKQLSQQQSNAPNQGPSAPHPDPRQSQ